MSATRTLMRRCWRRRVGIRWKWRGVHLRQHTQGLKVQRTRSQLDETVWLREACDFRSHASVRTMALCSAPIWPKLVQTFPEPFGSR